MDDKMLTNVGGLNRLGFHYYDDIDHFDEVSLDYWLPKLKAAKARWLVINIPEKYEVPENFLRRVLDSGIEPIINLHLSISNPPDKDLFRERVAYYRQIGVHLLHFFGCPNMKSSWSVADWQKPALVERFIEIFESYAMICVRDKIIPLFPLLQPGGDYWDLSFLKEALTILKNKPGLLPNMLFTANAGFQTHPLDWGKGGPGAYPEVRAYGNNQGDHRGFYIFEWYQNLIRHTLKQPYPIILLQAASWSSQTGPFDTTPKESKQQFFKVMELLQKDGSKKTGKETLPSYILACNLYKLPADSLTGAKNERSPLFKSVLKLPSLKKSGLKQQPVLSEKTVGMELSGFLVSLLLNVVKFLFNEAQPHLPEIFSRITNWVKDISAQFLQTNPMSEYFLIPDAAEILNEDQQRTIQKVLKNGRFKSGRNLNEALAAPRVILINDKTLYPQNIIRLLHNNHCQIQTVSLSKPGN